MRVTVTNVEEFIESLSEVTKVFDSTIRFSKYRTPTDGTKRDSSKFDVLVHATVVVIVPATPENQESEYLLVAGEKCGIDYTDATQELRGSERAEELKCKLVEFAATKNWKVRPGVISE